MRCPKCNKNVSRLYRSYCAGCLSELAVEAVDSAKKESGEYVETEGRVSEYSEPGSFLKVLKESTKTTYSDVSKVGNTIGEQKSLKEIRKEKIMQAEIARALRTSGLSESEKLAYKPIIISLVSRHLYKLSKRMYKICKKATYKDVKGGTRVVDVKGGLVVYEVGVYYSHKNQIPDSYSDDEVEVVYDSKGTANDLLIIKHATVDEDYGDIVFDLEPSDEDEEDEE